jgi:SAM-dependent methyltransferase
MNTFRSLGWGTDALESPAKARIQGIPDELRAIRFPFRLLRYWFGHELLADEAKRRVGTPLTVGEVGIDLGQMLAFSRDTLASQGRPATWAQWHGLDYSAPTEQLKSVGYDRIIQIDIENRAQMAQQPHGSYDVIILLHIVEHLFEPEQALREITTWLRPGGLIIGGGPGTPEFARSFWQRRLRRKARSLGHVSVISPDLLRRWAKSLGLETELLSGAFFMRKKGFALENMSWWLRANLAFGAMFPGWPGELYWAWRKP